MIQRAAEQTLRRLFVQYPVVTVTGPRQSGKTTLCRATFPELEYVNLERPDIRERAIDDPLGLLRRLRDGAIIDEIQRVPELLSYIQVEVDASNRTGRFVLTGSHQLRVSEAVSQSLAGRTGLIRLLPFSIAEAALARPSMTVDEMLATGFYPRIYDHGLDPAQALGDYFETYVERDVRQVSEIRNLQTFQRFVRLCAGRVGQLLNMHSLGNDVGVSHTTARHWISVLEAGFVVHLLPPFHANLSKRLIKSPKLYFYDVGLAAHLLGIETVAHISAHPLRGALFENLVVMEALKHRYNSGRRSNLTFYRDSGGTEVDLIYELAGDLVAIEVKAGETFTPALLANLSTFGKLLKERVRGQLLVYAGSEPQSHRGVFIIPPEQLEKRLREHDPGRA